MKETERNKADRFGVCPYVTVQKLLSGRWAILILHALDGGPRRFNVLQKEIGITQATLSSQLRHMTEQGLVSRKVYAEVPPHVEYSLTEIGRQFRPVLESIEEWGNEYIDYLHERAETAPEQSGQKEKSVYNEQTIN